MTEADIRALKAVARLLRANSTTKGRAPRYQPAELEAAIAGAGARLAVSTFQNPIRRA